MLRSYYCTIKITKGGKEMKNKDKGFAEKALTNVAKNMLTVAANSRCMLIYHQPKQPEALNKFKKF